MVSCKLEVQLRGILFSLDKLRHLVLGFPSQKSYSVPSYLIEEDYNFRCLIHNGEILIKLGAKGEISSLDDDWDEVSFGRVRQILISHGDAINSIQIAYDNNGRLVFSHRRGGDGDKFDNINFEPWETITFITGSYGPTSGNGARVIRSLTLGTTRSTYGPFGQEEGAPFSFTIRSGLSFAGFHGRSNSRYLSAIGIYVKPAAKFHFSPCPNRYSATPTIFSA